MPRIVHCADLHIGKPVLSYLSEEKASIRRREIETSLHRIIDLTRKETPDLLIISGDVFEYGLARPSSVREASDIFRAIPDTKVFLASGNHDPALPDSLYNTVEWPENVFLFLSPKIQKVVLPELGLEVYGRGWVTFNDRERPLRYFKADKSELMSIMVIHGDVISPGAPQESIYAPILLADVASSGIDYMALGHIHTPGVINAGDTVAVYPGCPEPLTSSDTGRRGVRVTELLKNQEGKTRVNSEFVPLSVREACVETVDITGLFTYEQVKNAVLSAGTPTSRLRDLWTVALAGRSEPEMNLDIESLERELEQDFFSLRLTPQYVPDYDMEQLADSNNQSLEARFARHFLDMRNQHKAKDDVGAAALAEQALYYGLDALRLGKVLFRGRRVN